MESGQDDAAALEARIAAALEATIARADFDHAGHLALATALVRRRGPDGAMAALREILPRLLARFGAPSIAYHETLSAAWVALVAEAVARFDRGQRLGALARAVIGALADKQLVARHYVEALLGSDEARTRFVPPDRAPLPTDGAGLALRAATVDDAAAIEEIYAHYVETSTCTFQLERGTIDERRAWLTGRAAEHPVIVAEAGGEVVAWGALGAYNKRAGYRLTVENSIYVRDGVQRRGIGRLVLGALVDAARVHGRHTIIAAIAGNQPASLALHARFGFVEVGRMRELGLKFGRRIDVVYLQRMLDRDD